MANNTLSTKVIDYYTDILCVWAWIAQPRLAELQRQWGNQVQVRHRYVDIFGDCHNKILQRWGQQDGFEKFSLHVRDSAAPFGDTPVNPDVWKRIRPHSSMQAHLFLKAVTVVAGHKPAEAMAECIRRAFFVDGQDVGQLLLLLELAATQQLDTNLLEECLSDGRAMAALSTDQRNAHDLGIKGSPTWVLNEGRQILYGNVGYRILSANIEELLKHPRAEASWC